MKKRIFAAILMTACSTAVLWAVKLTGEAAAAQWSEVADSAAIAPELTAGKPLVQYQLELGAFNSLRSLRVTEVVDYNVA